MTTNLIPLEQIQPGSNDRHHFDPKALRELAESIAEYGLAQPITVRRTTGGYQIVAGERRWRAHRLYTEQVQAGKWAASPLVRSGYIEAIVRQLDDEAASGVMLIENIQREDLNPMEEARAYQSRMDGFGWSLTKIAKTVKKSKTFVENRVKLTRLAPDIQQLVAQGSLKPLYGEEIAGLDFNRQRVIVEWLQQQSYIPTRKHLRRVVSKLLEEQQQESLFDLNSLFCQTAVEAAETEGTRVSDMLPSLDHLPKLPLTKGKVGPMVDSYIALLLEQGYDDEASVLLDFWRKMMKCNRLQVKPWDSTVLPLLG